MLKHSVMMGVLVDTKENVEKSFYAYKASFTSDKSNGGVEMPNNSCEGKTKQWLVENSNLGRGEMD